MPDPMQTMPKTDPDDLTWDKFIYPRGAVSQKTISAYVEALEIGAQFPPIKIQRVFNYTDADGNKITIATIILDGVHRWFAFKEMGIKEIAAVEWKDSTIIRLGRLGWTQDKISDKVGLSRNRVCEIVGNTNIGNIDTLLAQGHDMEYIARHFQMDLPYQQQPWLSSMLTGVILNPHRPQKKNPIKQSQYLTTTGFYQKRDGKQSTA